MNAEHPRNACPSATLFLYKNVLFLSLGKECDYMNEAELAALIETLIKIIPIIISVIALEDAMDQGASSFYFSFCSNFSALDTRKKVSDYDIEHHLFHVIDEFTRQYQELHELTKGKFVLHQSFPLCLWDMSLMQTMSSKHQLATSCQFLAHDGLLFDTNGSLIPCNLMYQIKLGEMGKDYDSAQSLSNY